MSDAEILDMDEFGEGFSWGDFPETTWREWGQSSNATDLQVRFASQYFACKERKEALRRAGEPVTGDQWRQTAFRLESSKAVTAILAAAARALAEDGGNPLDRARRRKLLEKHAQNGSAMVSIAACGALDKMDAYEDGMRAAEPAREPVEVIRALAVEWPAVAAACAAEIGIDPSAIPELSEEQRKRLQERERSYALDWIRQNPAEAQAILKAFPHAA